MVTGVRGVDPKTDKWTIMFAAPSFNVAIRMEGGAEGDRIVLRGHDDHGAELRWSFNDITPDSFIWRVAPEAAPTRRCRNSAPSCRKNALTGFISPAVSCRGYGGRASA